MILFGRPAADVCRRSLFEVTIPMSNLVRLLHTNMASIRNSNQWLRCNRRIRLLAQCESHDFCSLRDSRRCAWSTAALRPSRTPTEDRNLGHVTKSKTRTGHNSTRKPPLGSSDRQTKAVDEISCCWKVEMYKCT